MAMSVSSDERREVKILAPNVPPEKEDAPIQAPRQSLKKRSLTSGAPTTEISATTDTHPMLEDKSLTPPISAESAPETVPPTTGIIPETAYFALFKVRLSADTAITVCIPTIPIIRSDESPIKKLKKLIVKF